VNTQVLGLTGHLREGEKKDERKKSRKRKNTELSIKANQMMEMNIWR
jgi:hypothetical protein